MKLMIVLCLVAMVGLSLANRVPYPYPRGCIYVNGHCQRGCEEGTHSYTPGCGPIVPPATCDNPHPVADARGIVCDYTACECDPPTVRDTTTNKCVPLEECPKKEQAEKKEQTEKKEETEKKEVAEKKEVTEKKEETKKED